MKKFNCIQLHAVLIAACLSVCVSTFVRAQLPSYVPSNGLVAWYPFNGNANDESGNGNNGVVNGAVPDLNRFGSENSSFAFDGIDDRITIPNNSSLPSNTYTISLWSKVDTTNSFILARYILNKGCSPSPSYRIYYQDDGFNEEYVSDNWTNSRQYVNGPSFNSDWTFISVTYDGAFIKFYFDGVLYSEVPQSGLLFNSASDLLVGCGQSTSNCPQLSAFFIGNLDDIGIWNRALSPSEIETLYTSTSPCETTGSSIEATITEGETYDFNGQSLTAEGTYESVLTNAAGCDSVVTLMLTIDDDVFCYETPDGIDGNLGSYPTGWSYKDFVVPAGFILDSVFVGASRPGYDASAFDFTFSVNEDGVLTPIINYENYSNSLYNSWFPTTGYSLSNVVVRIALPTNAGAIWNSVCFAVSPYCGVTESSIEASIIEGETYDFNGQLLTAAGTYEAVLTNAAGCDSVVTLTLSVEAVPLECDVVAGATTICAGEEVSLNLMGLENVQVSQSNCWQAVSAPQNHYLRIIRADNGSYFVSTYQGSQAQLYTTNDPNSWMSSSNPLPTGLHLMSGKTQSGKLFISSSHNGVFSSTNNGMTWSYAFGNGFGCAALDFEESTPGTLFISLGGFLRGIYKSSDDGLNWSSTVTSLDFTDIEWVSGTNVLYAQNTNGQLWKSSNMGSTWSALTSAPFYGLAGKVESIGTSVWVFAVDGKVYRSNDQASTWSLIATLPFTGNASVYNNDFVIDQQGSWWLGMNSQGIWRSTNNGTSWASADECLSGEFRYFYLDGGTLYTTTNTSINKFGLNPQSITWSNGETTPTISVAPTETTTYSVTVTQGDQTCTSDVTIEVLANETYYADADGDGFGNFEMPLTTCGDIPAGYTLDNTDCNDGDALNYPFASCDDGDPCTLDDLIQLDCSCAGFFADSDEDGTCDAQDLCQGSQEPGTPCDDFDPCTINDVIISDCFCLGTFADGDGDGTCDANDLCAGPEAGTACDDNDPCTVNDLIQSDCTCAGTFADNDGDGTCDANDLCAGPEAGTACDDADACTINDVIQSDCTCSGTFADADFDGTCDANDFCEGPEAGTACDDNDPCTINDAVQSDCTCAGTFADADNDGTCDANDLCAGPEAGSACDDNDACTVNDLIQSDCTCAGTFADSDNDGTCDANDLCAGPEAGSACDDNDACTINDVIQSDCTCAGTFADGDSDGTCDASDICSDGPEPGSSCDDRDDCTVDDMIQSDCTCAGTFADADNDGTCDANDFCEGPEAGSACDDGNVCTTNDTVLSDCSCIGTAVEPDFSSVSAHACEPYTWNNATYSVSGTYDVTLQNAAGCDSIAQLVLTIGTPTTSGESATACGSFTWNGTTYSQSGAYTFVSTNASGCPNTATLNLTINTLSVAPTGVMASQNSVAAGTQVTLTVQGGSLGTGAQWKWYRGACGGSLIGTGSSVTITANTTNSYFVRAEDVCNTTDCGSVTVTVQALACGPLSVVASQTTVCVATPTTLTVTGNPGAGGVWKWYKNGCGLGTTIGTGSNVTVLPTTTTTYFVRAEGGSCGITSCMSVTIQVNSAPSRPAYITGPVNGLCNLHGVVYTTPAVSGAASYLWTLPSGATIVSGQGTNSITVNFGGSLGVNSSCGTTSICVRSVNNCGSSTARCVDVSLATAAPGFITGQSIVCRMQTYTYSIAPVVGATSYTWSIPSTWQILSGQGTTSITVSVGTTIGEIRVVANNACAASKFARKSVTITSCTSQGMSTFDEALQLNVWPNPASDLVHFTSGETLPDVLEIYDMLGKRLYSGSWVPEFDASSLSSGIYFVRIARGEESVVTRMEIAR